jgi:6,7-dimethyl-8-ribityllumazine synthase
MQNVHKQNVSLDAHGIRIGIVVARFNHDITEGLKASAMSKLYECKVAEQNITTISVPGAAEIPYALQKLAHTKRYDCLVALGCVIEGETPHFEYVCKMVQEGILRVTLDEKLPIGFGIVTVHTLEQAIARKHLGADAAAAALECALL